jgi:hypothetical protein
MKVDIKTVQEILRHQNLKTALEVYAKAMSEEKLEAYGMFLEELWNSCRGSSVGQYEWLITSKRRCKSCPRKQTPRIACNQSVFAFALATCAKCSLTVLIS